MDCCFQTKADRPTVKAKSSHNSTERVNSKLELGVLMISRVTSYDDFPIPVSSDWGGGFCGTRLVESLPSDGRRIGNRDRQTSFGDCLASACSCYGGILDSGGDGLLDWPQDWQERPRALDFTGCIGKRKTPSQSKGSRCAGSACSSASTLPAFAFCPGLRSAVGERDTFLYHVRRPAPGAVQHSHGPRLVLRPTDPGYASDRYF